MLDQKGLTDYFVNPFSVNLGGRKNRTDGIFSR